MTHQTFKKYAKIFSAIESILKEVHKKSECSDLVCKSVISIAVKNFYITSEFTLL